MKKLAAVTLALLFGALVYAASAQNMPAVNSTPTSCASGKPLISTGSAFVCGSATGVLGSLTSANFNTTADQAIPIGNAGAYLITAIYVTNCSTNLTTAAGGFYPTTSKGGTPIVAAIQVYTALSAATVVLPTTLAVTNTRLAVANIYLSLTAAQGGAATCDVYVAGINLG